MTRNQLINTIATLARELGYVFYTGAAHQISRQIVAYPALWLITPKIVAVEGFNEGRILYRITIKMICLPDRYAQTKEEQWEAQELSALELYRKVASTKGIVTAKITECSPQEMPLTNQGEMSMDLKMDVEVTFCND